MRAVDTNVLVYAEIRSSLHHRVALRILTELVEGKDLWALPWPCVHEFLRVITHPRVFSPPVPTALALEDLGRILASPTLVLLAETDRHPDILQRVVRDSGVTGNLLHDAHIAALCIEHGVSELVTGDRDFARFPIKHSNPFA
ncbi:MAG: TA system VapC family ribonuclease toxin [Thermoanaerobaculia bacterium]